MIIKIKEKNKTIDCQVEEVSLNEFKSTNFPQAGLGRSFYFNDEEIYPIEKGMKVEGNKAMYYYSY